MIALDAQVIKKNGKKEYAILPYEEFLKVQEELDDYEDLRCLREAKEAEKDAPTIGWMISRRRLKGEQVTPADEKVNNGPKGWCTQRRG